MLDLLAVAAHGAEEHVEATAFGIAPGGYVALAMLVVFGIMLYAKVPALVAKMLDAKIAGIREQLDEAARLRTEAAALKAEYEAKAREADAEIAKKLDAAAAALAIARSSALTEIEGVAAEAAREIVAKLTGAMVSPDAARAAVAGAFSRA